MADTASPRDGRRYGRLNGWLRAGPAPQAMDARIAALEARAAATDRQAGALEDAAAALRDRVDDLAGRLDGIGARLDGIADRTEPVLRSAEAWTLLRAEGEADRERIETVRLAVARLEKQLLWELEDIRKAERGLLERIARLRPPAPAPAPDDTGRAG